MPEYITASLMLDARMGEFDCSDIGEYCLNEWDVYSYPQLRFRGGPDDDNWFSIPYYLRDSTGIVNFGNRIFYKSPILVPETSSAEVSRLIDSPGFGHMVSVILMGSVDIPPSVVEVIESTDLRRRYQFIHVKREDLLPIDIRQFWSESLNAILVPSKRFLMPGSLVSSYPIVRADSGEVFADELRSAGYPGLWKIEDGMFQFFADQSAYKVLISQDPLIGSSNKTIEAAVSGCDGAAVKSHSVSFGIINGPSLATVLGDFGVSQNLGILVLGKDPLDFTTYYADEFESLDDLCSGIDRIIRGEMHPQYRGNFFSKWNYRYGKFLRLYGMDTELWRVSILISVLGLVVFIMVMVAGWFLRDIDPVELAGGPAAAATSHAIRTKKSDTDKKKD